MKNTGIVLMYNCSGPEYSKLRQIFAMLKVRMRPVTPDRYQLTLRELANGEGEAAAQAPEAFEEKMLVFCYMHSALMHQILEVIRVSGLPPIQLKAVLTETNQTWNSQELHTELMAEREELEKQVAAQKAKQEAGEKKD